METTLTINHLKCRQEAAAHSSCCISTLPSDALPASVLCCAVLCRAVLCCAVPCRAVPCRAVPCRATSEVTVQHQCFHHYAGARLLVGRCVWQVPRDQHGLLFCHHHHLLLSQARAAPTLPHLDCRIDRVPCWGQSDWCCRYLGERPLCHPIRHLLVQSWVASLIVLVVGVN